MNWEIVTEGEGPGLDIELDRDTPTPIMVTIWECYLEHEYITVPLTREQAQTMLVCLQEAINLATPEPTEVPDIEGYD